MSTDKTILSVGTTTVLVATPIGLKGDPGITGTPGVAGNTGNTGNTGPTGERGTTGNSYVTENIDGFVVTAGLTPRSFSITGGNVTIVGTEVAQPVEVLFPTVSTTLVGIHNSVQSIRGVTGVVGLSAGSSNISITQVGKTLIIDTSGAITPSGDVVNFLNGVTGTVNIIAGTGLTLKASRVGITLDFTGSVGAGATGPTGATGSTGFGYTAIGLSGDFLTVRYLDGFGIAGSTLTLGYVKGNTGNTGTDGARGNTGNTGSTGFGYTAIGLSGDFLTVRYLDEFGIAGSTLTLGYVKGNTGATGPVNDYVKFINGLTQGITLIAGSGITFTVSNNEITFTVLATVQGEKGATGATGATGPVSSIIAGPGIGVSGSTGDVTVINTGVTSWNGLTGTVVFNQYVSSLNGYTGGITLFAGTGVSLNFSSVGITFLTTLTSTENTFTEIQNFSRGISASGITLSGNLILQNGEFLRNIKAGAIDLYSNDTGSGNSYAMRIDFARSATYRGAHLTLLDTLTGTEITGIPPVGTTGEFFVYRPIRMVNDIGARYGTNAWAEKRWYTTAPDGSTGYQYLQLGVQTHPSTTTVFGLMSNSHVGIVNRQIGTKHEDPNLYIFSGDSGQTLDFIRIEHDRTDANIVVGQGNLNITATSVNIPNLNIIDGGSY